MLLAPGAQHHRIDLAIIFADLELDTPLSNRLVKGRRMWGKKAVNVLRLISQEQHAP